MYSFYFQEVYFKDVSDKTIMGVTAKKRGRGATSALSRQRAERATPRHVNNN